MDIKRLVKLVLTLAMISCFIFALASCNIKDMLGNKGDNGNENGGNGSNEENEGESGNEGAGSGGGQTGDAGSEGGNQNAGNNGNNGNNGNTSNPDEGTSDGEKNPDPVYPTVKVVNGEGDGLSGVIVKVFDKDGNRVGYSKTDSQGTVIFNKISPDNYTVEISFAKDGDKYYYDETSAVLTKDNSELTIIVYGKLGAPDYVLYGPAFATSGKAYTVGVGSYATKINEGITYFVFLPEKNGTYGFTMEGPEGSKIGGYGIPYYVQTQDVTDSRGDGFTIEIPPLSGDSTEYTPYVIGITSALAGDCVLSIERVGELSDNPAYKPWTEITAKMELSPFVVEDGKSFVSLDITDPTLKVVLDSNGYYHLGNVDGPIVVVKVKEASKYIDSFFNICETSNFGWYHFDENNNFVKKEIFNSLIYSYAEICDEKLGVCPLTEELAYAIIKNGEYHNWWNFDSSNHIFGDDAATIVVENAWLFACGTIE